MSRIATRSLAAALGLAFAAAAGQPALAQSSDSGEGQSSDSGEGQSQQNVKTDWSEQKLQQFAAAATDVKEVFDEYRPKIKDAEDADKANKMQKEASDEAAAAVKESGLSVEEYNRINQAIQADKDLYKRVMKIIRAKQGNGQGSQ